MSGERTLWDAILDASILFSFDRTGFERHAESFRVGDVDSNLRGRVCLVTGANRGLGYETALALAKCEARVVLLCRNQERGEAARRAIVDLSGNPSVSIELVDLADLGSVARFVQRFREPRIDVLVNNAGTLVHEHGTTPDGIERTFATHVVGHYLLTEALMPRLRRSDWARVITVTSGGMYLVKLDVDALQPSARDFDGVAAYAQCKRAQVVLTELWAGRYPEVRFNSMHPGWGDTAAVRDALPRFHRLMRGRLRSPEDAADTAIWLAICDRIDDETGKLWFDREARATHLLPGTRESERDRRALDDLCRRLVEPHLDAAKPAEPLGEPS